MYCFWIETAALIILKHCPPNLPSILVIHLLRPPPRLFFSGGGVRDRDRKRVGGRRVDRRILAIRPIVNSIAADMSTITGLPPADRNHSQGRRFDRQM